MGSGGAAGSQGTGGAGAAAWEGRCLAKPRLALPGSGLCRFLLQVEFLLQGFAAGSGPPSRWALLPLPVHR